MNEKSARSLYEQRIKQLVESLLPNGVGTMSETRLRTALSQVAQVAFSAGEDYALLSVAVDDVAERPGIVGRPAKTQPTPHEPDKN